MPHELRLTGHRTGLAFPKTIRAMAAGFLMAALLATPLVGAQRAVPKEAKAKQVHLSKAFKGHLPITQLTEQEVVLHALNRLGFGPRPGDIERVRKMGLEKWVKQQLDPQSLDDSALTARLDRFPTLAMSSARLVEEFPNPAQAARRMGMTPEEYRKQAQQKLRELQGGQGMMSARMEEVRAPQRIIAELSMAKLTRAVSSERQFYEQMADFWFNHFNVFAGKGADRWLLTSYERDAIRPHALGKFRDLLSATVKSPAMLFFLDNWMSADPQAFERMGRGRPLGLRRGLNENYARELMELHTLGVDGGYTQQDVIQVARCFTGWTIRNPRVNPEFIFNERIHDPGPKSVLGRKIDAGGMKDGEEVLEMLARHPSTARFISTKLARHFVSDNPPPALVDRMAKTFLGSDGDITAVMRTMIYSPEFWSRNAFRSKVKKPFELVASAARAVGADLELPFPLVQWTSRIGEPLYQCQPPTGYSSKSEAWVNSGALLNRLNFAMALAGNRLRGARVDLASVFGQDTPPEPQRALALALDRFLAGQVSPQTRSTLEQKLSDQQADLGMIAGLVLGSPEFQRR